MKLNEIYRAPPSFEEVLYAMKKWFGIDFGLKKFDHSSLHSDPKIAKALADKAEAKLQTIIGSNKITLHISFAPYGSDIKHAAPLNLEYDASAARIHCTLNNTYSFDVVIKNEVYYMVDYIEQKCIEWFDRQVDK